MRRINYAGGSFVTTDEVSTALLQLVAGIAARGLSQYVEVPVTTTDAPDHEGVAQLIVGIGSSMMSLPTDWVGVEPDFSTHAVMMQMQAAYPRQARSSSSIVRTVDESRAATWDEDYDGL
ncbi:hypothetical protein CH252_05880 [Rhodococcus sp. 06-1477-1B]|nr:hypothetical protein CH252_05880 [Rhodococcus sp. 06-1477-1B]